MGFADFKLERVGSARPQMIYSVDCSILHKNALYMRGSAGGLNRAV